MILLMPPARSFGRVRGWPGLPRKSLSSATAALALVCTAFPAAARAAPGSLGAAPARGLSSAAGASAGAAAADAGGIGTVPPGFEAAVLLDSFPAGNQSKVDRAIH